ncbi:MAG: transglutaminase family protein [Pseudomonadota bacterium]
MSAAVREPANENDRTLVSTDLLEVRHRTVYRYKKPVTFEAHRGMFRPHEGNDLRLLGMQVTAEPEAVFHWVHDVFSNSITVMEFVEPADRLEVTATFSVVSSHVENPKFPIEPFAEAFPFRYPSEQVVDLATLIAPEYSRPGESVKDWAQAIAASAPQQTMDVLQAINAAVKADFAYERREEPGIQTPRETLDRGAGSCRDFAVLMLDAVRQLGFAARFVTGYLYDPITDEPTADATIVGAGATHAWIQVFLPGAGWIEFDPTNGLVASGNLIRTGVARTPAQAAPLRGAFVGASEDFLDMTVEVEVRSTAPTLAGYV